MALRKSPVRTAAMLAANRANAGKCTGPSTPKGKARVALNALKHGRYAVSLPEKLLRAGDRQGEAQYRWFRKEVAATFGIGGACDERQADQMAARAWCVARCMGSGGTKPESPLDSESSSSRVRVLSRIRIVDRRRRIGLAFWAQRPRYWTLERQARVVQGRELFAPPPGCRLERRWRRLRFRARKPGFWEQMKLDEEVRRRSRPAGRRRGTNRMN